MIYPAPLVKGSVIAVTAFSAGIEEKHEARYQHVINGLIVRGYIIKEGQCLRGNNQHVSAPLKQRVEELMAFLLDDTIDAIAAPWGGELVMELLPLLDFDAIAKAKPKWIFGFSDISTLSVVMTAKLGWASAHTTNLMDLAVNEKDPLLSNCLKNLSTPKGGFFIQYASLAHTYQWPNIVENPEAILEPMHETKWRWLVDPITEDKSIKGRLIGGCWDTLMHLFDTPFLDLNEYSRTCEEGVILYLENVEMTPADLTRTILSMKFKGVFDQVSALMLGRSAYPKPAHTNDLSYQDVIERHLTDLGIPVLIDMDIGHVPPNLTLINGALAHVTLQQARGEIVQYLA